MKTVVIAETESQVDWALSQKDMLIIPVSSRAQYHLVQKRVDPSYYLELNPDKKTSQLFIDLGHKFANNWFTDFEDQLQIQGANFGVFCRMHWLFFIPEILRSYFVVSQIIKKYQPNKIIIFPKDQNLSVVDDDRRLESFVVERLDKTLLKRGVSVEKRYLTDGTISGPIFSATNFKRYFDYFYQNPEDILKGISLLWQEKFNKKRTTEIPFADLVLHSQRHIITDSIPLLKEIHKAKLNLLIIADSLLLSQRLILEKNGIQYIDYNDIALSKIPTVDVSRLKNFWQGFKDSKQYKTLLKKYSLDYLKKAIDAQFEELFDKYILEVAWALKVANGILKSSKPRAMLLSGNSGRRGLAFAFAARRQKVTSFLFQHGVDIPPVQSSNIFDYMIVWGRYWQRWYSKNMRLPKSKFYSAGWFYADNISNEIKGFKNISSNRRPIVFFPLAYYMIDNYKLLTIVSKVIREFAKSGRYRLIIRPHPGQNFPIDLERYTDNADIEWDLGKNLDRQLQKCDLILTLGTTVGLRAMLWQKPLIHLKILDVIDEVDFKSNGAAIEITKVKQIIPTINRLLSNKEAQEKMLRGQKKFILDNCFSLDGNCSARVLDFVRQQINL